MNGRFEQRDGREVIVKEKGKPFRILQLTDVHIGGSLGTRKKDKLALAAVEKVVKNANADFVAVTGDMVYPMPWMLQGSFNNLKSSKMFASLMESLGVEWTVVFGNHDSEVWAKLNKQELADFYASQPHCHFQKGDSNIFGVGNYCIPLLNEDGSLNTALMFIDSNAYLTWNFFSGFDVIHDDQIEWYKKRYPHCQRTAKSQNRLRSSISRQKSSKRGGKSVTEVRARQLIIADSCRKRTIISDTQRQKKASFSAKWSSSAAAKACLWGTTTSTRCP